MVSLSIRKRLTDGLRFSCSRQRFPWHLDKCKKNYVKNLDNLGFPRRGVMCRYDCGAKEFPQEILRHEEVCIYKPAFAGMEEWFGE